MFTEWFTLSVADTFGLIALAAACLWPLLRSRRAMLTGQAASAALFTIHYVLLDATTAAALCALVAVQVMVALPENRGVIQRVVFFATIPLILSVAAFTWAGIPTALCALGSSCSALARWQQNTSRMRMIFLVSGALWLAHNIMVMSPTAMAADIFTALGNIRGLWKERQAAALSAANDASAARSPVPTLAAAA